MHQPQGHYRGVVFRKALAEKCVVQAATFDALTGLHAIHYTLSYHLEITGWAVKCFMFSQYASWLTRLEAVGFIWFNPSNSCTLPLDPEA